MTILNIDFHLPLFLYSDEKIVIFVIDNKLTVFEELSHTDSQYFRAYEILSELVSSFHKDSNLLSQFSPLFTEEPVSSDSLKKCLMGEDLPEFGTQPFCLTLHTRFQKEFPKRVILYDIFLEGKEIDIDAELAIDEAFHIFANLCVNSLYDSYLTTMRQKQVGVFDSSIVDRNLLDSPHNDVHVLCFNYLNYMKKTLQKGSVHPEEILRTGGIGTLNLLSELKIVKEYLNEIVDKFQEYSLLTFNQKIVYYTLLVSLRNTDFDIYPTIAAFFKQNRKKLTLLRVEAMEKRLFQT